MAAGSEHAFTDRTRVYALYSRMKNDPDGSYGLGQSGAGGAFVPAAGNDPSAYSVGISHRF
jgi:predicted porin